MAAVGKHPKLHVVDSGLAAETLGLRAERLAAADATAVSQAGHLLETFVVNEILKQAGWADIQVDLGYFRTHDGVEVDLVAEAADGRVVAAEVKAGTRVRPEDVRGLRLLRDRLGDRFVSGVVLYTGERPFRLDDRLLALPIERVWTAG